MTRLLHVFEISQEYAQYTLTRYEDARFVKVGKSIHYIMEDMMMTEKATSESHPEASWLVDVERA